jgi:hypothetical protein
MDQSTASLSELGPLQFGNGRHLYSLSIELKRDRFASPEGLKYLVSDGE